MPNASPAPPAPPLGTIPGMIVPAPNLKPSYPHAGMLGLLAVALAYFALGVGVGVLMKVTAERRRWLPLLIGPGALAAIGYLVWVARSLA
jgi:hypothetical protein